MGAANRRESCLHGIVEIPAGKTVGDLLEVFQGVKHNIFLGEPNRICAGCRKPFDVARKPRKAVRLYPVQSLGPIAFSYNICGHCLSSIRKGGYAKQGVLASVEAFHSGEEAGQ